MAAELLRRWLAHPLTASLADDDPKTTELRKQIIQSKPFLKAIYEEWYERLAAEVPRGTGGVLELGSGAGFLSRYIPGLITSEVFPCSNVSVILNAQNMPMENSSLRAIAMTDVLHHMPDVRRFFAEASRCLRSGGKILMIEPWVTPWSTFVYRRFHSEPFLPEAPEWEFATSGPVSGANVALPWMVFARDRARFEKEFPALEIEEIRPFLPFRYLLSGGVSMKSLMPGFAHGMWALLERSLDFQRERLGMFAFLSVRKR
ncbi:MAG TPA: methyltransferase domain-containing protein [Candidatus Acidoferrum sp.]|nr:methyltransferase domain-containing protein [Candidatus Acidoferrum sp.]